MWEFKQWIMEYWHVSLVVLFLASTAAWFAFVTFDYDAQAGPYKAAIMSANSADEIRTILHSAEIGLNRWYYSVMVKELMKSGYGNILLRNVQQ